MLCSWRDASPVDQSLISLCLSLSLIFSADDDFYLENNDEFAEFLRKNNPTAESFAQTQKEIQAEIKYGLSMIQKAANMAIQKVSRDAKAAVKGQAQSKGATRNSRVKRSLRNSSINEGNLGQTVERRRSERKRNHEKNDIDNDLSQELEEKAIVTAVKKIEKSIFSAVHTFETSTRLLDQYTDIPEGKVRVQVFSATGMVSPHLGEVFEVEPKTKGAGKKCKIGRSNGEEYKKFGIPLPKDLEISQKHGVLSRSKNKNEIEYFFEDHGSSNGTFDDNEGVRLEEFVPYKLKNGTQLRMGQCSLQFTFSS